MSHDDTESKLEALRALSTPTPSEAARARALEASTAAFAAKMQTAKADATAPSQGDGLVRRLMSMMPRLKGHWTMDMRLPLGTAAAALLLFPLGMQLYNSTALTPAPTIPVRDSVVEPAPIDAERPVARAEAPEADAVGPPPAAPPAELAESEMAMPAELAAETMAQPSWSQQVQSQQQGVALGRNQLVAPSPVGGVNAPAPSGDVFTDFAESRLRAVSEEPVSTFSIDVDTASYAYVRRMLEDGYLPEPDAVRIEEMVNYFPYGYPVPADADTPFAPDIAIMPTPWNAATQVLRIGIQGHVPVETEDAASNLVFLIDTSGSMEAPDKLPLLRRALGLLVDQLGENDTVSIVVYAGSAGIVLEPTAANEKATILSALDRLAAGGSTAGADGIELAYRLAEDNLVDGGVNRVILATDGDFNVGLADPAALEDYIATKRDSGVFLSVLGFGTGNLGDDTMQSLAQNGNGQASYISSFREAHKVLVEELGGTLRTIAKDVKIQVEFNPDAVSEYRLIGYETRALNREDFNNDAVDAGEIGAGHSVTALYEITPAGSDGALIDPLRYGEAEGSSAAASEEIGFLRIRYKLPDSDVSALIETPITPDVVFDTIADAPEDVRFAAAVAAFGQTLKGSRYAEMDWADIRALAQSARGEDAGGYRTEFLELIDLAATLSRD
jgi:Ca-activated chloride channel family protein